MARLSSPPDTLHATPLADRISTTAKGSTPRMPSPTLRPLSLEASLQSHGNDNLSPSPIRCGSSRSSFLRADCRTLSKILRNVSHDSPPATSSPLQPVKQLFADTGCTDSAAERDADEDRQDSHLFSDEAADTGYLDEDDSMELSEGTEGGPTDDTLTQLGEPTSPSVSYSERQLQDSVSMRDQKDKLKCTGRRLTSGASAKPVKFMRRESERSEIVDTMQGDTIEDGMNLPGKRAPPKRPQDLGLTDSNSHDEPKEDKHFDRLRHAMEKVLIDERVEQERAKQGEGLGVWIPLTTAEMLKPPAVVNSSALYNGAVKEEPHRQQERGVSQGTSLTKPTTQMSSHLQTLSHATSMSLTPPDSQGVLHDKKAAASASDADNKDGIVTNTPDKAWSAESKQGNTPIPQEPVTPHVSSTVARDNTTLLVPNTPTIPGEVADQDQIQCAINEVVPETPFTKTLSYFKMYKGSENSPFKRRRNTALPQEIFEVSEIASKVEDNAEASSQELVQDGTPESSIINAAPVQSAVADLRDVMPAKFSKDTANGFHLADKVRERDQTPVATIANLGQVSNEGKANLESAEDDAQKQMILYPQHPAFVNAIGMIPATMFWVTAAPVVKYACIAVDLLIDKLRDTYL